MARSPEPPRASEHFVLVHGSCHGAWSWYKLVPLIKSYGHRVTAVDLAASGVDPTLATDLRSVSGYYRPLMEAVEAIPAGERVVLVGHSLGGLAISYAMERFPAKIAVAVFLTALMPGPELNVSELYRKSLSKLDSEMDNRYTYENGPNSPPTTFIFGPLFLASKVYPLSSPEDLALATMLMRPLPLFSQEDYSDEIILSGEKYGSVKRVYVFAENDIVFNKDIEKWMLNKNQPNEVVKIMGSDHMVMMSKPLELWTSLQTIVEKYC